jgi:hypothetical protein
VFPWIFAKRIKNENRREQIGNDLIIEESWAKYLVSCMFVDMNFANYFGRITNS